MKTLTVLALVCAVTALTGAAPDVNLVKRWTRGCSWGWSRSNDRCFLYVARPMTWAKAEKNCQYLGGNLASVRSLDEYHKIQIMILTGRHGYKVTWIGGSDAHEEKHWFWSDGTPFRYTNWCRGQPDNSWGRQHCLQMNYGAQKCWDDNNCSARRPSVCSKKA
ncbi:ladderlectin [Etheostoma spectabile]|uniref:ladderlectin n=1 Tax=Etheostoma spectabile TaxID=54343 RepID=UPI0013AE8D52|nr:ladderlectin-like [Etheostoma spectabile]